MTAVNIYLQASLIDVCIRLIVTLTLFYMIGCFTQRYIRKKILKPPDLTVRGESEVLDVIIEKEPTLIDDDLFPDDDLSADGDLPHENDL